MKKSIILFLLGLFLLGPLVNVMAATHKLTLIVSPAGSGYINSSTHDMAEGESINLYATPTGDFQFKRWSQDGKVVSTSKSYRFVMGKGDVTLTAEFAYNPPSPGDPDAPRLKHLLELAVSPSQGGAINKGTQRVAEGDSIPLFASPFVDYAFKGWQRDGQIVSTNAHFGVKMGTKDIRMVALFEYNPDGPGNPGSNPWNATTGELIADDFKPGKLSTVVDKVVGSRANRTKILSITVSGEMNGYDLNSLYTLVNCVKMDLSRTFGYSQWSYGGFNSFEALKELMLPQSVNEIENYALRNCKNLTSLTLYSMEPPRLSKYSLPENTGNLNVYVLPGVLPLYISAEGWKDLNILPITGNVRNLTVALPTDAADGRYKGSTIELLNKDTGAGQRLLVTRQTAYTFGALLNDTRYTLAVKTASGAVLGEMDNVAVGKEDAKVAFTALKQPQTVSLRVVTPTQEDVTAQTRIRWYASDGTFLQQGGNLEGQVEGSLLKYTVTLEQSIGTQYMNPTEGAYKVTKAGNVVTVTLDSLSARKISGTVKDASTGDALAGATVTIAQKLNGQYDKTVTAQCNALGEYTADVYNAKSNVTFAAKGYISQTKEEDGIAGEKFADVALKPITGVTVSVHFTYTRSVTEGETPRTENYYTGYADVGYEVKNLTTDKALTNVSVQYPQIVIVSGASKGDRLQLTATSTKNDSTPVVVETVVGQDDKADATFALKEHGRIRATYKMTENEAVVGMLYNAGGQLVDTYEYKEASFTTENLDDGSYTLVSMAKSDLFNNVLDKTQLEAAGLKAGIDYAVNAVEVKSGAVVKVNVHSVPALRSSLQSYTKESSVFTANKSTVVVGNYVTLKGRIAFKEAYALRVGNVKMEVDLPAGCHFVEKSVMVGTKISSYSIAENKVIIPLENANDEVRFCILPTMGGVCTPNALVKFTLNGKKLVQPVGNATFTATNLSIMAPATSSKPQVRISGTAPAGSSVKIMDGDVLIGETQAKANGMWKTSCTLHEPFNLSTHSIQALVTTTGGLELKSERTECWYDKDAVEAKTVQMTYYNGFSGKNVSVVFNFETEETSQKSYMFYNSTGNFTFVADLTNNNPDVVKEVTLNVFTSNQKVRRLTASYDEKLGKWVAASRFDAYSLPVNLSVDIDANTPFNMDSASVNRYNHLFDEAVAEEKEMLTAIDGMKAELAKDKPDETKLKAHLAVISQYVANVKVDYTKEEQEKLDKIRNSDDPAVIKNNTVDYGLRKEDANEEMEKIFEHIPPKSYTPLSIPASKLDDGYTTPAVEVNLPEAVPSEDQLYVPDNREWNFEEVDIPRDKPFNTVEVTNGTKGNRIAVALAEAWTIPSDTDDEFWERFRNLGVNSIKEGVLEKTADLLKKKFTQEIAERKICLRRMCDQISAIVDKPDAATRYKEALDICVRGTNKNCANIRSAKRCIKMVKKAGTIFGAAEFVADVVDSDRRNKKWKTLMSDLSVFCDEDEAAVLKEKALEYKNWVNRRDIANGVVSLANIGVAAAGLPTGGVAGVLSVGVSLGQGFWNDSYTRTDKRNYKQIKQLAKESKKCRELPPNPYAEADEDDREDDSFSFLAPGFEPLSPILDPSGYVYEAVASNRLQGVTATCYYKETVEDMYGDKHEEVRLWNAEEYAQENPLFTDEDGMYQWDVPQGMWQVRFEKEGYEPTQSEWLPVPPPQLDVNIAMTQNTQPQVKAATAYTDGVDIEFDKYMLPETMNTINIAVAENGIAVKGEVKLLNAEKAYGDAAPEYASKVRFVPLKPFTAKQVALTVSRNVKSYAGVRMQNAFSQTFDVNVRMGAVEADSALRVVYGGKASLAVRVLPASASAGRTLRVKASGPMVASVDEAVYTLDKEGRAELVVNGNLPGTAALEYSVDGSEAAGRTLVNVVDASALVTATPVASIASGSSVLKGTGVTLKCATPGAVIYYTLDGSCPCDNTTGRHTYDGSPILINSDTEIRAMAMAEGLAESEVAVFSYKMELSGIDAVRAGWRVYPKTVTKTVHMRVDDGCADRVTLADASGKVVMVATEVANDAPVDVSHLPHGVYIVTVTDNAISLHEKVVKAQ